MEKQQGRTVRRIKMERCARLSINFLESSGIARNAYILLPIKGVERGVCYEKGGQYIGGVLGTAVSRAKWCVSSGRVDEAAGGTEGPKRVECPSKACERDNGYPGEWSNEVIRSSRN